LEHATKLESRVFVDASQALICPQHIQAHFVIRIESLSRIAFWGIRYCFKSVFPRDRFIQNFADEGFDTLTPQSGGTGESLIGQVRQRF
tara:strand:- start:323 stop:589 length:267 start_codon:yes stop_codon:yes gene_type:complete